MAQCAIVFSAEGSVDVLIKAVYSECVYGFLAKQCWFGGLCGHQLFYYPTAPNTHIQIQQFPFNLYGDVATIQEYLKQSTTQCISRYGNLQALAH